MIKEYCDACGIECIRNYVSNKYMPNGKRNGNEFGLSIIVCTNKTWNSGAICFDCLKEIFIKGHD